jgi:hypothetical protein
MSHVIRNAARALLGALFIVCVYRAITQSITHDEAFTWELYLAGPSSAIFHRFDANHHFLNTILMRISAAIFGTSEFSLRLPALLGAALYFAAVDRLAFFFKNAWMHLLAVALMTLNPFVLDFMVAARGYGLALAFWTWALILIGEQNPKRSLLAGTALGLSIMANLVFLPPAGLLAAVGIYVWRNRATPPAERKKKRSTAPQPIAPWIPFLASFGGVCLLYLLAAPFENASLENFYVGADTIAESLRSLTRVSLQHSGPFQAQPWISKWVDIVAFAIAPLISLGGIFIGYRRRDAFMLISGGVMIMSALGLIAMHLLLDRPYPADRTGIYFLSLVALMLALIGDREPKLAIPVLILGSLFAAQFATEFNLRKFYLWEYDADTKSIAQALADRRDRNAQTVRVGASYTLSRALFFYASKNNWPWLELTNKPTAGLDFNVLAVEDRKMEPALGVVEIYEGPVSHSVLTARR